jgi:hypothetical protein
MKKLRAWVQPGFVAVLVLWVVVFGVACASLEAPSGPDAVPVQVGSSTTNDPPLVGWLQLARDVNSVATPPPYREAIGLVIGGAISIVSGLVGWFARQRRPPSAS